MFKYEKFEKKLYDEIISGTYKPGDKLPSENEIPSQYKVSKNTARKAIQQLLEKGLIYRVQGRGTFVTDIPVIETIKIEEDNKVKEKSKDISGKEIQEKKSKRNIVLKPTVLNELLEFVEEKSGQLIFRCYQCGKCSAGCPAAGLMDHIPSHIIRLLQLGDTETIVNSNSMWYCVSCLMCDSRCPKGIEVAKIMEAVRVFLLKEGVDYTEIYKIDKELLDEVPQQALVSNFRKLTG